MSAKTKAMLESFGRVLIATTIAAYLELGKKPLELDVEDLKSLLNAAIGAAILTAFNYARTGETRFGRGSKDLGMGGDDKLERPGGQVNPGSLAGNVTVDPASITTTLGEREGPEQSDNRPRPEDGEQMPPEHRGDYAEWTGEEMR